MGQRKTYNLAGVTFRTQKDLEAAVKEYLSRVPLDTPFQSRFLRDIVNTLHTDVIEAGQESTGDFEYLTCGEMRRRGLPYADLYRGGKVIMTLFEPLGKWQDVTVYPWRNRKKQLNIAHVLRIKAAQFLPNPTDEDRCAHAGCSVTGFGLRYHHVRPAFADMVKQCESLFSPEEVASRCGYSKFKPGIYDEADCVSEEHPAIQRLKELHGANQWVWLCAEHHIDAHKGETP